MKTVATAILARRFSAVLLLFEKALPHFGTASSIVGTVCLPVKANQKRPMKSKGA